MNNILLKIIILNIFIKLTVSYNCPKYTQSLAKENYKLVPYFANKYYYSKHKLTFDQKQELCQEGYIGLMYACRKYDETKGLKLSTYGRFWICRYMSEYIKNLYKKNNLNKLEYEIPFYDYVPTVNLDVLKPIEKEVIYLRYYQNYKVKEIAEMYDKSRNTISSISKNGINKLKINLENAKFKE